jgi:bud site selection protein 31
LAYHAPATPTTNTHTHKVQTALSFSQIMPLPPRLQNIKNQPTSGGSKRGRNANVAPDGFEYIQPVLEALENELRDVVKQTDPKQRKLEAMWPIHQINHQRTRYVYDMYYVHHRISKQVYQYCINNKYIDAALAAKWKKPGYERLCSTYVINPTNYKFGTTSICRVPLHDRSEATKYAQDPTVCTIFQTINCTIVVLPWSIALLALFR